MVRGTDLVAVVMYEDDDNGRRRATVKAAQGMLDMFGRKPEPMYDIRGFNCEHFAVLCRHGFSRYDNVVKCIKHQFHDHLEQPVRMKKLAAGLILSK